MTDETATEVAPETPAETPAEALGNSQSPEQGDGTYDAAYVAKLRQEAAESRVKAKRADALARQATRAITAHDGRLIDPDDLAFTDEFLDDDGLVNSDRVVAAIESLIERKPHLAARRPNSTIAQGVQPEPEAVSLLGLMQSRR